MCTLFEGQNFRHNLYPSYKSNRPPTPDTIVQGLQYLKASIKAMSIKVIEASCEFILRKGFKGVLYYNWYKYKFIQVIGSRCRSRWCDWNISLKECWCWVQGDVLSGSETHTLSLCVSAFVIEMPSMIYWDTITNDCLILMIGTSCLPRQRLLSDSISFITSPKNCSTWWSVSIRYDFLLYITCYLMI